MKKLFIIILTLLLAENLFSQGQDSIKAVADAAVKMFTWDIQKVERGALMFLDVAYKRDNQNSVDYLTLTVAKDKSKKRPEFISLITPNNIVQSNGIFVKFAKTIKPKGNPLHKIELEKGNPIRINFEKCDNETCTARLLGGYVTNEKTNEKIDIFQKCLDFDQILFLLVYDDGSRKSIAVPLFSFKQQYKQL